MTVAIQARQQVAFLGIHHTSCVTASSHPVTLLVRRDPLPAAVTVPINALQSFSSTPPAMLGLLPLTLVLSSWGTLTNAGSAKHNEACNVGNQKLEFGTYQFQSDCDSVTFCNSSSLCDLKGCRKDEFPFGYSPTDTLPPRCDTGFFCPDEGSGCQPVLAVDSPCQFNRDGMAT